MPLTNAGRNLITSLLVGAGGTVFNNANSYIGVGDSTTAFAATQTDLQAVTNKYRQVVDATFPTIVGNVLTFQITVATGNANFDWSEWGIFNASTAGTMLNRKQEELGVKASTQSWQFTVTITVNNP
jgi:hypothetical protein